MQYRTLGRSGLKVSEIGLGGNDFGRSTDEPTSLSLIAHALELGINFIDTADNYSQGRSEAIIGKALKGKRSQFVIATKFGDQKNPVSGEQSGSRSHILKAIDLSLKRLDTDYIDLYYMHYPDPQTPIEETLWTLDCLIHSGKVRYIGCSNFAAWELCAAFWISKLNHLEPFAAVQPKYNLLYRSIESELVPCCQNYGIGVVPWGPLASGFLTGKYHKGTQAPKGARLANPLPYHRDILSDANYALLDKLEGFSQEHGRSVGELAIAWLLSHPWLSSVIAGATSTKQLSFNAAASSWKLTADDIAGVEVMLRGTG